MMFLWVTPHAVTGSAITKTKKAEHFDIQKMHDAVNIAGKTNAVAASTNKPNNGVNNHILCVRKQSCTICV